LVGEWLQVAREVLRRCWGKVELPQKDRLVKDDFGLFIGRGQVVLKVSMGPFHVITPAAPSRRF